MRRDACLHGIDYVIAELFLNLLARSMDRENVGDAHPNEFRVEELAVPANYEVYLDHLHSLNLLQFVEKSGRSRHLIRNPQSKHALSIAGLCALRSVVGSLAKHGCPTNSCPTGVPHPNSAAGHWAAEWCRIEKAVERVAD